MILVSRGLRCWRRCSRRAHGGAAPIGRVRGVRHADPIEAAGVDGGLGTIEALEALDAFGAGGRYDRWRWPGCTAAPASTSCAAVEAARDRFESVTLLSPYPDASLSRLSPARSRLLGTVGTPENQRAILQDDRRSGRTVPASPLAARLSAWPPAWRAEALPSEPIALGDGHVTLGGDVSASVRAPPIRASSTTPTTNTRRCGCSASTWSAASRPARTSSPFSARSGARTSTRSVAYALYLRIRPWTKRDFDIEVGRIPPTFGAFARRTYANDNPLIGYPLGYQYLTSLRPDAVPANADELLRMRGRGWLANYSIGDLDAYHGVPLVSAFRWDTGVQVHAGGQRLSTPRRPSPRAPSSNPQSWDDNNGRQIAGTRGAAPGRRG